MFREEGVTVCIIDKVPNEDCVGDISDKAGFITGENICIDGGMTKQMIYHGDNDWILNNE